MLGKTDPLTANTSLQKLNQFLGCRFPVWVQTSLLFRTRVQLGEDLDAMDEGTPVRPRVSGALLRAGALQRADICLLWKPFLLLWALSLCLAAISIKFARASSSLGLLSSKMMPSHELLGLVKVLPRCGLGTGECTEAERLWPPVFVGVFSLAEDRTCLRYLYVFAFVLSPNRNQLKGAKQIIHSDGSLSLQPSCCLSYLDKTPPESLFPAQWIAV